MIARTHVAAPVLSLSMFLAGCGKPPPPSMFPSADDALARMHATYACVNGVQGTAKIDHFSPRGRVKGDIYIFAVNPARVRFDVVSPFGATIYTLTSDGERFKMLDLKEKQFLYGPASACNLARLTQVPVPGHALVSILRGEAPVLVHKKPDTSIEWDSGGFYKLILKSTRDASEVIKLKVSDDDWTKPWNEQRVRVIDVLVSQRGGDLYHAEMSRHEATHTASPRVDPEGIDDPIPPSGGACDAEIPRTIRMLVPGTEQDVIFQYRDAKWNPPLVQGAFDQPEPGGVRKVFVDCADGAQ